MDIIGLPVPVSVSEWQALSLFYSSFPLAVKMKNC